MDRGRQHQPREEQEQYSDSNAAYVADDRTPGDCKKLDTERQASANPRTRDSRGTCFLDGPHTRHQKGFELADSFIQQALSQHEDRTPSQRQVGRPEGLPQNQIGAPQMNHGHLQPQPVQQDQHTKHTQPLQAVESVTESCEGERENLCRPDDFFCGVHLLEEALPAESAIREADHFITTLRAWRCSEEAAVQQLLQQVKPEMDEVSEKAATPDETPALQLNHLLEKGTHVVTQLQVATAGLRKEVEEVQKSLRISKGMDQPKMEPSQTGIRNPGGLPSLGELTDDLLDMELRVAALSELHDTWEREQVEAAGELRKLQQELGQYCHDIKDVLEEASKTQAAVLDATHPALQRKDGNYQSTWGRVPRARDRLESDAGADEDASASAAANQTVKDAVDSLLRECQQTEQILDAVLGSATAASEAACAKTEEDG